MLPPGTAPVKAEYIIQNEASSSAPDDDAAESGRPARSSQDNYTEEDGRSSRKRPKAEKKSQRGANKGRRFGKVRDDLDLCYKIAQGLTCEFGTECRFNHDINTYLGSKPRDIRMPLTSELSSTAPFVATPVPTHPAEGIPECLNFGTTCPVYQELGVCRYGLKCRFLGGHAQLGDVIGIAKDEERQAKAAVAMKETNFITPNVQKLLRTKKYPLPATNAYLQEVADLEVSKSSKPHTIPEPDQDMEEPTAANTSQQPSALSVDDPDVPLRAVERKRLDWSNKTYLAPLTTVGNLPFRRLCVKYGADITCGEMGLSHSFLTGSKEEWSLVRRHPDEKMFGIQLAGNKANTLVAAAEVIGKECPDVDFVDLNCGCPIDLVFNTGSGAALLDAPAKLSKILTGMRKALNGVPVTVKLRTGIKDSKNTAHILMPRLSSECRPGAITLHGRSRQQRYTKMADWDYIRQCVEAVRAREADEDLVSTPIFGGGDCYSSQDYWSAVENQKVDGVMIGRGALIKPWIFTEVKEHREWDISSRERLDLIRQYAEYGLSHFGSDTAGVNATRRYLCESLSFQYRYVPLGLLESLPGRINDRAPLFRGRDELETLLGSPNSQDWVKISEMFLGTAPDSWAFTPKHKSNSYESQG